MDLVSSRYIRNIVSVSGPTPLCPDLLAHPLLPSVTQLDTGSSLQCSEVGPWLHPHPSPDEGTMEILKIIISVTMGQGRRGCGERRALVHCWWECGHVQPLWKLVWKFLRVWGSGLPQGPAIPLLGMYRGDAQSYYGGICSTMIVVALFVMART